jgi:voltage-gated potassium channel
VVREGEIPSVETRRQAWLVRFYERLTIFRALRIIVIVAVALIFAAAGLQRLVEPEVFSSYGLACWWAVETITTVGYGDIVPRSDAGRAVASLLMLVGLSLIPTLTSAVVSTLIAKRSSRTGNEAERARIEHAAALARIEERLERLERPRGD